MKLFGWLRRAFCTHDWECIGDVMSPGYRGQFRCRKCGKVEGL